MRCKAKRMSATQLTTLGADRNKYHGGYRDDLGMYVRSRWEANWARYLDWLKRRGEISAWEYEPKTFEFPLRRGAIHYTPDFRVVDASGGHEWHEVKGWMDPKSKTKLRRMAKYYPNETVKVIDQRAYKAVFSAVGPLIDGWERTTAQRGRA